MSLERFAPTSNIQHPFGNIRLRQAYGVTSPPSPSLWREKSKIQLLRSETLSAVGPACWKHALTGVAVFPLRWRPLRGERICRGLSERVDQAAVLVTGLHEIGADLLELAGGEAIEQGKRRFQVLR